jgi:hemolysin-activating ACP:hemolysin acyltransferase
MTKPQSEEMSPPQVRIMQHPDQNVAVGLAVSFIAAKPPFANYPASRLVSSILGQVQRGHFAFAIREGCVVGYIGWALCTNSVVEAWLVGDQTPASEQCRDGEVVVPIIIVAEDSSALRRLVAFVSKLYPGRPYAGRRILTSGGITRRGRLNAAATKRTA